MELLLKSCLNIKSKAIRLTLISAFALSSLTTSAQTTSLVINFDLEGFTDVSYSDSFTMRYAQKTDSMWIFEHSFHCPKDFHWSDTISPVPLGDVNLAMYLDSVKVLESYFWVDQGKLNEYDIEIDRQYHRSVREPFISEDFVQGYFRLGSNVSDWGNSAVPIVTYSMYSGFHEGIMLSQRFGVYHGYGLNYELAQFKNAPPNQILRYNYWSMSANPGIRIAPFGYENDSRTKRNTYLDVSASYFFPLRFRYASKANDIKILERLLHDYTDFRVQACLTISRFSVYGNYRLTDFVRPTNYPELPRLQLGVGLTNRL